jgi:hypothetical protein
MQAAQVLSGRLPLLPTSSRLAALAEAVRLSHLLTPEQPSARLDARGSGTSWEACASEGSTGAGAAAAHAEATSRALSTAQQQGRRSHHPLRVERPLTGGVSVSRISEHARRRTATPASGRAGPTRTLVACSASALHPHHNPAIARRCMGGRPAESPAEEGAAQRQHDVTRPQQPASPAAAQHGNSPSGYDSDDEDHSSGAWGRCGRVCTPGAVARLADPARVSSPARTHTTPTHPRHTASVQRGTDHATL